MFYSQWIVLHVLQQSADSTNRQFFLARRIEACIKKHVYIYIFIHCKYANIPKHDMLWHLPRRIYLPQTRDFSNRNWMTWGYPDTVEQSSMSGRWFTSWSFVSLTPSISGVGERWDSSLIFGQDCPWRFGDVLTFKLSMQAKWLGHGTWQGSLIPHIV